MLKKGFKFTIQEGVCYEWMEKNDSSLGALIFAVSWMAFEQKRLQEAKTLPCLPGWITFTSSTKKKKNLLRQILGMRGVKSYKLMKNIIN